MLVWWALPSGWVFLELPLPIQPLLSTRRSQKRKRMLVATSDEIDKTKVSPLCIQWRNLLVRVGESGGMAKKLNSPYASRGVYTLDTEQWWGQMPRANNASARPSGRTRNEAPAPRGGENGGARPMCSAPANALLCHSFCSCPFWLI